MAKKKNVPTANVREDRAPAAVSETPISTYFDIQPKSTPGSPKGVAGATWVNAPGGGFTLVKNATPSIPKGVVGAEWILNPPELGKAGTVTEETFGYKLFQPTPISTPAMPKGVAGATWVQTPSGGFELKPDTGKPDDKFVQTDGGLTPSSMITPEPAGYAIARRKLAEYGITGIDAALKKIREDYPELPTDDIIFLLENDKRYNAPFEKRFAANIGREKKGLPRLSAADYIAMEQGYKKIFSVYNLPTFANQAQYDKLIENDVDVDDTTDRVVMAYDRVLSDTNTRAAFGKFYSNITDSDIVSALLDPETQIPVLQKKVIAAEIGGQALKQGLATSLVEQKAMVTPEGKQVSGYENVQRGTLGAQALTAQGVTESLAATGYEEIASRLPEAEKLSSIYAKRAEQYGQKEAEQESLLKMASAQRKREKLTAIEEATFSGESGTMRTSLGRRGRSGAF